MSAGNRGQLAEFLRSRRTRLTPADVGLPGDSEVDIRGLRLPDWEQITSWEYEPWDRGHLVIDTATRTPAEAVATILAAIPAS